MRRICGLVLLVATAALSWADGQQAVWQRAAEEVFGRQWALCAGGDLTVPRPQVTVRADPGVNAFARAGTNGAPPQVVIHTGMIGSLLSGSPEGVDTDALAGILAHELAHLLLGHHGERRARGGAAAPGSAGLDPTIAVGQAREEEFAADAEGARIAARAGYGTEGLVRVLERARTALGDQSTWELFGADHPTMTQRLLALDRDREAIWQAALDFEVGVDLLRGGNHWCAQECFRSAQERLPESPQIAGNLGYALLAEYYHRLPPEFWRAHRLGQVQLPGFAQFLPVAPRRTRTEDEMEDLRRIWREAVAALQEALRLEPGYALARANLGLAWLICPDGPEITQARADMEEALAGSGEDARLAAAVHNNMGIAWTLAGDTASARDGLRAAQAVRLPAAAVNLALLAAESGDPESRRAALADLEKLLPRMDSAGGDWDVIYARYREACAGVGLAPRDELSLRPGPPRRRSLHFETGGVRIYLGDQAARICRKLGSPEVVAPVTGAGSRAALTCWAYPRRGVELVLLRDLLLRVRATSAEAALVVSRSDGTDRIRVGATVASLETALGETHDDVMRIGGLGPHRLYSRDRLAAQVREGRIVSMALAGVGG